MKDDIEIPIVLDEQILDYEGRNEAVNETFSNAQLLAFAIEDERDDEQGQSIVLLCGRPLDDVIPIALSCLTDTDRDVRIVGAKVFRFFAQGGDCRPCAQVELIVGALTNAIEREDDPVVLPYLLRSLGNQHINVDRVLLQFAYHADSTIRDIVANCLLYNVPCGARLPSEVLSALAVLAQDDDEQVVWGVWYDLCCWPEYFRDDIQKFRRIIETYVPPSIQLVKLMSKVIDVIDALPKIPEPGWCYCNTCYSE